jgi:chaperonin GroES
MSVEPIEEGAAQTEVPPAEEQPTEPKKYRKLTPIGDRVIVKRKTEEQMSAGGIIIPDTAKEKPQEGVVVAVGPGRINEHGVLLPMNVKMHENVLFGKYAGNEVELNDEMYLILREEEIMVVIEDDE